MSAAEPSETGKGPPRVGSYRLLQSLGSGGMSSVFHAVHEESGHEVAVKVLPRTLAKNPTLLQRFLREAKNAESLEHENIASIYDRGFDQGRHYLVLEYVEGGDLHDRVRNGGPLAPAEAVRVIRAIAQGLRYALTQGVIHRDVKPANLLMTPAGQVKIIDLGLALQTEAEDERVTRDGTTVGTVDYMAPEQARDSRATSERSDIYSLGCTFYFLVTGSPPFPGGDVPDKLGRHCTAPAPDVRDSRPEISEELARLIQKMMAKKPEGRFPGYDELIAAIDALPEARGVVPPATMDALLADDEDDDLLPFDLAAPSGRSAERPTLPAPASAAERRPARPVTAAPVEVSLAELAELDADDEPTAQPRGRFTPSGTPASSASNPYDSPASFSAAAARPKTGELPLSTWIAAGAVLGLAIALLGYGALQLLGPSSTTIEVVANETIGEGQGEPDASSVVPDPGPAPVVSVRPATRPASTTDPIVRAKPPAPPPAPPWIEPSDPVVGLPDEPPYGPAVEAAYLPEWARRPIPTVVEGPNVILRRVIDPADADDVATLRQALDKNGGVVEVADNGPFFEDDCRVNGKARLIRARRGFRPMIKVEASSVSLVRDRPAVFVLDGGELTLDGLDLLVDVRDLPASQSALFLLKGAKLTFHDCTITVLNAAQRPFSLARVEDPSDARPNRVSFVRVERSLVRGASPIVVDLFAPTDVVFLRSVVLGGTGSIVAQRTSTARGDRRLFVVRSVLATRGAAIQVPGARTVPIQVRALASTFAKVSGVDASPLVLARTEVSTGAASVVDWMGQDNAYLGWPAWLGSGDRGAKIVAGLAMAQQTWRGTDALSRESRRGWPGSALDEDATPATLKGLEDDRPAVLARVASPSPSLFPAAEGVFLRQPLPEMPARPSLEGQPSLATAKSRLMQQQAVKLMDDFQTGRARSGAPTIASGAAANGLVFDTTDPAWRGDLGLFLARKISPGSAKVRVAVHGGGTWPMTPVRLPEGVSLELDVVASQAGGAPTFVPASGASSPALILVVGGDLALRGVNLANSPSARVPRLVQVEDGHLLMMQCVLRAAEGGQGPGSALVLFRAAGTRPLSPPRAGPFLSPTDRPTCQITDSALSAGGGEGVAAEMGRGVVGLTNCAIVSGADGAAIALRPRKVAAARFEADLALDHCTIAAEHAAVRVGPWPGAEPGPARPWLVSTHRCVFLEALQRGRHGAALLRSIGDGLPHAALSWQATGDAYDLVNFTAVGEGSTPSSRTRPDVKAQWIDLWGPRHILGVLGPNPRRTDPVLTLLTRERPRAGSLSAEGLALDPKAHPDLGADLSLIPAASSRARAVTGSF